MDRHHAPRGRLRLIVPAVGGAVLVALTAVACTTDQPAQPPVARVERGIVTTGVSANGSLSAISQQNVGFPNGGQLTNVFVKVGDRVEAGQVLATVDDFALRQTLVQQEGRLRSQQAALDRLVNSPVAEGAQDSASQAEDIVAATRKHNKAVLDANEVAIDNAERQLSVDKEAEEDAEDRLERSKKACDDDSSDERNSAAEREPAEDSAPQPDPQQDRDESDDSDSDSSEDSDSFEVEPSSWTASSRSVPSQTNPACSAVPSDEAAVTAAEQKVEASRAALKNAQEQRDIDKASGDLAIANAEQSVVNARNTANSAESDRPFDIEEQRGELMAMQAAVATAKRDVDNATLRAPVAGTVSVINGVVGEFLAPSSGTSALAPGSSAAIPGAESGTAGASPAAAGPAAPTRPGGAQFLMLDNIDAFQVVVPFNESDAATIVAGQKVNVMVDALPDLTLAGSVLAVAPSGTSISGVISYYVTVVVNGSDPRLKDGQTARATVVTEEIDNVLTVPSAAVRQENGKSTVTVVDGEVQRSIPFEPGTAGPDRTQVMSGLREGQQVLLPVAR
jgi:HlyD family secretion protein